MNQFRKTIAILLFLSLGIVSAWAQQVKGKVIDDTGEPVIGAGVLVKGTTNGTITDMDGNYSIAAVKGDVIEFSSIGYATQEVEVAGSKVIDIVLKTDNLMLSETVVVGYGTQKKVNLTGAVAVVDAEQLANRQSSTLGGMLQGTMPNVNITFGSGQAGQNATVNIRGVTSIASSTGPLILVDGVEMNMSDVNPNDVESISVLKDASAAAVYGSRAAFGVVLITTKGAKEGKATVTYNGKFSFGDVTTCTDFETRGYYHAYILDMFGRTYQGNQLTTYTAEDYHQLWLRRNDRVEDPSRPWVVETEDGQYKYYGNFDWYNFLYDNTRPTHDHNISVQGGTDKVKYFISGNFYDQKGTMRINPDHYTHYTVRGKVQADVKPWLQVSLNTNFSSRNFSWPGTTSSINDYYNSTFLNALASIVPMNPDGTLVYRTTTWADNSHTVTDGVSAMALYGKHQMKSSYDEFRIKGEAVIKPVKQLDITLNYTFTNLQNNHLNRFVEVPYSEAPGIVTKMDLAATENKIQESFNLSQRHVANAVATYHDNFDDHDVKVMAGFNYENMYYKKNYMRRYGLLSEDLADFNLAVGDQYYTSGGQDRYIVMGFFFRANYSWKDRYLAEVSGRYDGSSRFAKGHRWGFFPSFSLGWRVSEEEFFAPARGLVDNLKIRFSYGGLGNQAAVGYYDYIQTISTGSQMNYSFGDSTKAYYAQETNPNSTDLTWEKVYTSNLGVDLAMFKGKLTFSIDGYIRDTKDMIMQAKALPSTYGASAPKSNSADLRTYGGELSISWNDSHEVAGDPFHYYATVGLGDNVSFVTRYDDPNRTLSDPYVGQKLGDIWGYRIDGLFATDEEAKNYPVNQAIVNGMINTEVVDPGLHAGDLKYMDLDGNGVIEKTTSANDVKDMVIIGNSLPRLNYSFTLGFDWKGIDFSVMFQGIGWQNWYPGMDCTLFWGPYARPYTSFVGKDFMSKVWSEDNPNAYLPRPRGYVANKAGRELAEVNDRYLQNIGYLRLKNLTLGYSLPKKWMDAIHMQKIRVFFSGENLLTFTGLKSKYIDPEQAGASNTWKQYRSSAQVYPYAITYTFGIDIVF